MKQRLNKYTCQNCRGHVITVDRDEGTTPFMIGCMATPGCDGDMYSSFYKGVSGEPLYEWRKATPAEYAASSTAMRQHFDMGGLDIHPINRPPPGKTGAPE
jgi:hypothetical protein